MIVNFLIVQFAPGGPIESLIAQIQQDGATDTTMRIGGGGVDILETSQNTIYLGNQGLPPEFIEKLEQEFGFDKPLHERFFHMMGHYLMFDFGTSYFQNIRVVELVLEKMPVSLSLGLWTILLTYVISIPLGIRKAVQDGTRFDVWTSALVTIGYAIPSFLFGLLLIVVFAGGRYLQWFPLRGLVSEDFETLSLLQQILDYLWHITLPVITLTIGSFASLTMLTKNSFLEEMNKNYVLTARAKGLGKERVLYGHIFRNAMLVIVAGFPSAFISILFTGSVLIEVIFSLDGLGLLGFEAVVNRDYNVMFATLYFLTLLGLFLNLIGDILYVIVDPRIDFEARRV